MSLRHTPTSMSINDGILVNYGSGSGSGNLHH